MNKEKLEFLLERKKKYTQQKVFELEEKIKKQQKTIENLQKEVIKTDPKTIKIYCLK